MRKSKNRILAGILIGLIAIFLATNYLKKNSKIKLNTNVIAIDTSQVIKIDITKALSEDDKISFAKSSKDWQVSQGAITSDVNLTKINSILNLLNQLKIERLVAKTKDKWGAYQLDDSTATKVNIKSKKGDITSLYLGKNQYGKPTNQYSQYNASKSTYIRVNGNPKVYSVKGMLSDAFNSDFNAWRDSEFLKVDKNLITQIHFNNPKAISFILQKKDSVWKLGNLYADSTKVAQYLNNITYKTNTKFADEYKPKTIADYKIRIAGNNMSDIVIKSYKDSLNAKYYLHSSLNPNVFFESDSTGLFKQLFLNKEDFLSN